MYSVFKDLCDQKGVKPGRVALDCGITPSTMTRWKNGEYKPKADKMQKIADYFNVSLEYLMTGENPPAKVEGDLNEISQMLHYDYLLSGNDDLKLIVEVMSKWNPKHVERMRKKIEEMDSIIGGES